MGIIAYRDLYRSYRGLAERAKVRRPDADKSYITWEGTDMMNHMEALYGIEVNDEADFEVPEAIKTQYEEFCEIVNDDKTVSETHFRDLLADLKAGRPLMNLKGVELDLAMETDRLAEELTDAIARIRTTIEVSLSKEENSISFEDPMAAAEFISRLQKRHPHIALTTVHKPGENRVVILPSLWLAI